jgi:xanthine/CO dehydrogenase XdhC/CoxF family maturation factor
MIRAVFVLDALCPVFYAGNVERTATAAKAEALLEYAESAGICRVVVALDIQDNKLVYGACTKNGNKEALVELLNWRPAAWVAIRRGFGL